jgi:2-iminobutanoate/2-iminopropanoate deaminase
VSLFFAKKDYKAKLPTAKFNLHKMEKKTITTTQAPAPIGPYNQAILSGNMLFISGQICINPATGELSNKDIKEETNQVMKNLKMILQEAQMDFSHVVKTTIFLTDMHQFAEVNEVYGHHLDQDLNGDRNGYPARETVQVSALPKFVNVEISMIAVR